MAKTGRNLFLPDGLNQFKPRFKPCLAETCQPCFCSNGQWAHGCTITFFTFYHLCNSKIV